MGKERRESGMSIGDCSTWLVPNYLDSMEETNGSFRTTCLKRGEDQIEYEEDVCATVARKWDASIPLMSHDTSSYYCFYPSFFSF